jgi:nitroreductase
MDTYEAIMTRRSVRRFKSDPISDEQVWKYLEAANMAPTASNNQPWRFIVIRREQLDKIQSILEDSFNERAEAIGFAEYSRRIQELPVPAIDGDKIKGLRNFYKSLGKAPIAILVYVEQNPDPWRAFLNTQDASAAIENLILAAWADGVGSCWMCGPLVQKNKILSDYFGIPEKTLIALIPLGYPEEVPPSPPKGNVRDRTTWFG